MLYAVYPLSSLGLRFQRVLSLSVVQIMQCDAMLASAGLIAQYSASYYDRIYVDTTADAFIGVSRLRCWMVSGSSRIHPIPSSVISSALHGGPRTASWRQRREAKLESVRERPDVMTGKVAAGSRQQMEESATVDVL